MYAKPRVLVMQVTQVDYAPLVIANLPASISIENVMLLDVGVLAHPAPIRALVEQRWLLSHMNLPNHYAPDEVMVAPAEGVCVIVFLAATIRNLNYTI